MIIKLVFLKSTFLMKLNASPNFIKRKCRKYLKRFAKFFGVEIKKYSKFDDPKAFFEEILKRKRINIVYDVGANVGLFSIFLREIKYLDKIICFEPVLEAYKKLQENLKNHNTIISPRAAIGDMNDKININVSGHTGCSSILPMLQSHESICPGSEYQSIEEVKIITLDEIYSEYLDNDSRLLLKIDTQGYEYNILKGASKTLEKCQIIIIELSIIPLYKDQKLWKDMIDLLEDYGFDLWHLETVTKDPKNHKLLQLDGIFLRKDDNI